MCRLQNSGSVKRFLDYWYPTMNLTSVFGDHGCFPYRCFLNEVIIIVLLKQHTFANTGNVPVPAARTTPRRVLQWRLQSWKTSTSVGDVAFGSFRERLMFTNPLTKQIRGRFNQLKEKQQSSPKTLLWFHGFDHTIFGSSNRPHFCWVTCSPPKSENFENRGWGSTCCTLSSTGPHGQTVTWCWK